jgi:hypothetical protein
MDGIENNASNNSSLPQEFVYRACLSAIRGYTVQSGKLLLALASTVILGSESHGTPDHILLPDGYGSLQSTVSVVYILKLGIHIYTCRLTDSPLIRHRPYRK